MQPSSSRHKISVGAIVGGVAGGLIVVSTLSLLLFLRRRRNSRGSAPAPIIADHDSVANGSSGPREAYLPGVWESETQPRMLSDAFPPQASASRSPRVKMAGPEQASTPHIPSPQRIHDTGYMRANLVSLRGVEVELLKLTTCAEFAGRTSSPILHRLRIIYGDVHVIS